MSDATKATAERLIGNLDSIARGVDHYEYGLPVYNDAAMREMVDELVPHLIGGAPIDLVIPCPRCGMLHVDAPEPEPECNCRVPEYEGAGQHATTCALFREVWANPPHRSHKCHGCGHVWRPADVATNGVAAVKTRGEKDGPADDAEPVDPDWLLSVGATGGNDEPNVDVYDVKAGCGLVVRVVIRFRRGEIVGSSIGLAWSYRSGAETVSLTYAIDDDPTRGTVRRLCRVLGVPLAEGRPCAA